MGEWNADALTVPEAEFMNSRVTIIAGSTTADTAHARQRHSTPILPRLHPPRPRVPVGRGSLEHHADTASAPALTAELQSLWDEGQAESRAYANRLRSLARYWSDPEGGVNASEPGDHEDVMVAAALRTTIHAAHRQITDAHVATAQFPRLFSRLESGELPAPWMQRILARTRALSDDDRVLADGVIDSWDLRITADAFHRSLGALVTWLTSRHGVRNEAQPEARRRVELGEPAPDGTACLSIIGPIPEILSLSRRIDAAARAVQAAQRRAIEDGQALPLGSAFGSSDSGDEPGARAGAADPISSGAAGTTGSDAIAPSPMSLAQLRYALLTGAALDTEGVSVPADRFRINVTVPAMTLLGAADAPGMLDGITPIPAAMARSLAGGESTWHRILTDPATGAFLPLPATTYAPSRAMLEHLRLRNPVCAVPGCTRPTSAASEADHIIEYDHRSPASGGPTAVHNLHLLGWQHHLDTTAGRIDPVRIHDPASALTRAERAASPPDRAVPPPSRTTQPFDRAEPPSAVSAPGPASPRTAGATRWTLAPGVVVEARDEVDLVTPLLAGMLERAWSAFVHTRSRAAEESAPVSDGEPPASSGASSSNAAVSDGPTVRGLAASPGPPPF